MAPLTAVLGNLTPSSMPWAYRWPCVEVTEQLAGVGTLLPPCGSRDLIQLWLGSKPLYSLNQFPGSLYSVLILYESVVSSLAHCLTAAKSCD